MTKHSATSIGTRAVPASTTHGSGAYRGATQDIDISAVPVLPPKNCVEVTLEIERVVRPPVIPLEWDEVDLELFDL